MAATDLSELERRLAEAEETIRAIRDGEVDALIIRGDEQDQVFHLVGGRESYRAFMESMDLGAAALDEAKRLVYANAALAKLLGASPEALQRDGLSAALGSSAHEIEALVEAARDGKQTAQTSLTVAGHTRHIIVTAAPLPLNFAQGYALTFTDITERIEAAAIEESERVGRAIMESASEAVVVCDRTGVVTHANPAAKSIASAPAIGLAFEDAFQLAFAPDAAAMHASDFVAIALTGGTLRGIEASVSINGRARDLLISAAPLRPARGAPAGCIVTLVDLTDRKTLEKRQSLLMSELDHRMKNMLALVQAISMRTLGHSESLADFGERFSQRLAALAATQNLLAEKAWEGLNVHELIRAELAPYVATDGPRVEIVGDMVEISRDSAVALGLVVHELVTNAVKYGALSNETGRIFVRVTRDEADALEIAWEEKGGPPVSPPKRRGFGQAVIARGLGSGNGSSADVEFRREGVVCRMRLPAESLG